MKKYSLNNNLLQINHKRLTWLWLGFLLACALLLVFILTVLRYPIDSDLLALLPADKRNIRAEQAIQSLAEHGEKQLLLLLESKHRESLQQAAERLTTQLADLPITPQSNAINPDEISTFYLPFRHNLISDTDRAQILLSGKKDWYQLAVRRAYDGFSGGLLSWQDDPFGLFENWLFQLVKATPVRKDGDWLTLHSEDRHYIVLSYRVKGSAFSVHLQQQIVGKIEDVITQLKRDYPSIFVLRSGVIFHVAAAAAAAQKEITLIGLGSLLASFLLLWLFFRNVRVMLLITSSLAAGALVALPLTWLVFERLHLLTLVFSTSLIGVAVDYGILSASMCFARQEGNQTTSVWRQYRKLLPVLMLVLIAPITAYSALFFLPFHGLKQIAVFSIAGITSAWLTVIFLYPYILPSHIKQHPMIIYLMKHVFRWPTWKATKKQIWGAVLFLIFIVSGILQIRVDDDVRTLIKVDTLLSKEQISVSRLMQLPSPAQMFVITGDTPESVLQKEEQLNTVLNTFVAQGNLSGYDGISLWLPSLHRQQQSQTAYTQLYPTMVRLQHEMSLSDTWLMAQQHLAEPLTMQKWLGSSVFAPLHYFWLSEETGMAEIPRYASMVLLKGLFDRETAHELSKLNSNNIMWFDKTQSVSDLMEYYRGLLGVIIILAYIVVPVALFPVYRQRVWRVVLPSLLASLATLAVMGHMGISLQLISALGLLLTFGMGIDYGLFLVSRNDDQRAFIATFVAAALTIVSFGLLALSSMPVLHTLGTVIAVGIFWVWLIASFLRPLSANNLKEHNHFCPSSVPQGKS